MGDQLTSNTIWNFKYADKMFSSLDFGGVKVETDYEFRKGKKVVLIKARNYEEALKKFVKQMGYTMWSQLSVGE